MLRRITHSRAAIAAAVTAGAVTVVTISTGAKAQTVAPGTPARNVILLQGDGMGTAQRELIRLMTVGKTGELAMNKLEHTGLVRTDPDDPSQMVTDSAAAATAFATGVKSYNGAIATGPDRLPAHDAAGAGEGGRQGHRGGHHLTGHRRLARRVRLARAQP